MVLTDDDGSRSQVGVVVTLRDMGGGKTRVTLDDVRSGSGRRDTQWAFDVFYTHKDLDTVAVDGMKLPIKNTKAWEKRSWPGFWRLTVG